MNIVLSKYLGYDLLNYYLRVYNMAITNYSPICWFNNLNTLLHIPICRYNE
jgi:hypothetical protein